MGMLAAMAGMSTLGRHLSAGSSGSSGWTGAITSNQQELVLRTWALANGWDGSVEATITINSGVYIWSDNTATPALSIGSFPGGLTLINNGYVIGKGGRGGQYDSAALPGGPAVSITAASTLNIDSATGYIGGGGGGGGEGFRDGQYAVAGGGGAGGGDGGKDLAGASGGIGGTVGTSGSNGGGVSTSSGGGGGRIIPGTGGSSVTSYSLSVVNGLGGGSGGSGGAFGYASSYSYSGAGGSGSAVGSNAVAQPSAGGGGGGWGAAGGNGDLGQAGGAGGKAIALNGFSIASVTGGSHIYGSIS